MISYSAESEDAGCRAKFDKITTRTYQDARLPTACSRRQGLDNGISMTAGRQLTTTTADNKTNQKWQFTLQSDGTYQLVNVRSGLCADVNGGSNAASAAIIQWDCGGGSNQRWTITQLPNGQLTVASLKSGLMLTTASTTSGALVTPPQGWCPPGTTLSARPLRDPATDSRTHRCSRTSHHRRPPDQLPQ